MIAVQYFCKGLIVPLAKIKFGVHGIKFFKKINSKPDLFK